MELLKIFETWLQANTNNGKLQAIAAKCLDLFRQFLWLKCCCIKCC